MTDKACNVLQELSVKELMNNHLYIIPIYQRNYAWGDTEITQLIQDIHGSCQAHDNNYYIGSLIVACRTQHDKINLFETIDGQQRHTTLTIICAALKSLLKSKVSDTVISIPDSPNLSFDCRTPSSLALKQLFAEQVLDKDEQCEQSIMEGYSIALNYLKRLFSEENETELIKFANHFLKHVKIIRVVVPEGTDLNHYFEIMNNRGEQLEKHEILKARLLDRLGTSTENDLDRNICALIWDACANMQRYALMSIPQTIRNIWCGKDYQKIPCHYSELRNSYEHLCLKNHQDNFDTHCQTQTLEALLQFKDEEKKGTSSAFPDNDYNTDRFDTVIDFPNFLLHVLDITCSSAHDVILDDKKLLEQFDTHIFSKNDQGETARRFILNLFQTRLLFDTYIIKRDTDKWSLLTTNKENNYINTFGETNKLPSSNNRLIMLQSMFHVSFSSYTYKHWLNAILRKIASPFFNNTPQKITASEYIELLESVARQFFIARLNISQTASSRYLLPQKSLHQGTHVHNFILNYLDYHLWLDIQSDNTFYTLTSASDGDKKINIKNHANNFSFTARTSIEHYWPQHPEHGENITESQLPYGGDNFANLCLISRQQNSRLSNLLPAAKKEYYIKSRATESLKQILMMSYTHWGFSDSSHAKQGIANMRHHLEVVLGVLRRSLKDERYQWD